MVGGNGWMGMAHPHVSPASRVRTRGGLALAAAMESSPIVTAPEQLRHPSRRPIDQRWDQSRGITFHTANRTKERDHTSNIRNGISIACPHGMARAYATRKIGKPVAQSPSIGGGGSSFLDNAHASVGFGGSDTREVQTLKSQKADLENKLKMSDAKIEELKKGEKDLKASQEGKENRWAQERADYENSLAKLQSRVEDEQGRADLTIQRAKVDLDRREVALELKEEGLQRERKEGQRRVKDEIQAAKRRYEADLARIALESNPERRQNMEVLNSVRREGYIEGERAAWNALRPEIEDLRKTLSNTRATIDMRDRKLTEMGVELSEVSTKLLSEAKRADSLEEKNVVLEGELDRRRKRGDKHRVNYPAYRELWASLRDERHQLAGLVVDLGNEIARGRDLWSESKDAFRNSKALLFFHQGRKYSALRTSILEYLQGKADEYKQAEQHVTGLRRRTYEQGEMLQVSAHKSRELSRYHHWPEAGTSFTSSYLTEQYAKVYPLREWQKEILGRADDIRKKLSKVSGTKMLQLQKTLSRLNDMKYVMGQLADLFDHLRDYKAWETMLHDSPVEKRVHLKTFDLDRKRARAASLALDIIDAGNMKDKGSGMYAFRVEHQKNDSAAREALKNYANVIRKKALVEQDLGKLSLQETRRYDSFIRERMDVHKQAFEAALGSVCGSSSVRAGRVARQAAAAATRASLAKHPAQRVVRMIRTRTKESATESSGSGASASKPSMTERSPSDETSIVGRVQPISMRRRLRQARSPTSPTTEGLRSSLPQAIDERKPGLNLQPTEARKALHSSPDFGGLCLAGRGTRSEISRTSLVAAAPQKPSSSVTTMLRSTAMPRDGDATYDASALNSEMESLGLADAHHCSAGSVPSRETCDGASDRNIETMDKTTSDSNVQAEESEGASEHSSAAVGGQIKELEYQIPAKDYRSAVMTSTNSNAAFWSYNLYRGKEGKKPSVYYCTDFAKAEERAKLFLDEPVLGFDLEWEVGASLKKEPIDIKQNISLIQLASEDKIGLFQVALFKGTSVDELLPPTLRKILQSPSIAKSGVNVGGDARRLKACMNVDMQGVFELSHLYKIVKLSATEPQKVNFGLVSLAKQVENVLLLPLKKDSTRTSAWSHRLNTQQTDYAASDAYAGFQLYYKLDNERIGMSPPPSRPAFSELNQPMLLGNGNIIHKGRSKAEWLARKSTAATQTTAAAEEEVAEEEFFDAVEEPVPYEFATPPASPGNFLAESSAGDAQPAISGRIAYPELPKLDLSPDVNPSTAQEIKHERDASSPDGAGVSCQREGTTPAPSKFTRPHTVQTQLADAWVERWQSSLPPDYNVVGRPRELRAWHLWHEQGHNMDEVAALLKDPPLVMTTVASYILQSIKAENLPYDKQRVKEVLSVLPRVARARYPKILRDVGDS